MGTKITLGGGTSFGINIYGVVRTGGNTGFASDTGITVELDYSVLSLEHSRNRTDIDTGWFGAMVAAQDTEMSLGIGESAFLHIFDKGAIHREGNLVLGLAGSGTCMTADTLPLINCPGIIHASPRIEFLTLIVLSGESPLNYS